MNYLINKHADTAFIGGHGQTCNLDMQVVEAAVKEVNRELKVVININNTVPEIKLYTIASMRSLSASMGERFVDSFATFSNEFFIKTPHQDGYPDLLLNDDIGRTVLDEIRLSGKMRDKAPFSPYSNGGIEVKATCGSVPSDAAYYDKRNLVKPDLGDTRIDSMKGYGWAAHHRETTNLLGIFWDFDDRTPQIMGVFFGNTIDQSDWGKVSIPKVGSKTTNSSGMSRVGIKKMYDNWLITSDDNRYIDFLNRYNHDNLIG